MTEELTNLFSDLAKKQQPLGPEFEKILYENLWDLYQGNDDE